MKFHQVAAATATDREGNIENDLRPSLHAFLRLFKQLKRRAGAGQGGGRCGRGTEATHENGQNMKTFASRYAPKNRSHLSLGYYFTCHIPCKSSVLSGGWGWQFKQFVVN